MADLPNTHTRRGILGVLAFAPAAFAVPAIAAKPSDGWSQLADVMALQHPEGRAMTESARAAGMKVSQLFCVLTGPTIALLFEDDAKVMHKFYPPSEQRQ